MGVEVKVRERWWLLFFLIKKRKIMASVRLSFPRITITLIHVRGSGGCGHISNRGVSFSRIFSSITVIVIITRGVVVVVIVVVVVCVSFIRISPNFTIIVCLFLIRLVIVRGVIVVYHFVCIFFFLA